MLLLRCCYRVLVAEDHAFGAATNSPTLMTMIGQTPGDSMTSPHRILLFEIIILIKLMYFSQGGIKMYQTYQTQEVEKKRMMNRNLQTLHLPTTSI